MQLATKRETRSPGQRGKAWAKRETSKPYPGRQAHRADIHRRLKEAVEQSSDAAALVQIVRECQVDGTPVPGWVPGQLESLLVDFMNLAKARRAGSWTRWARKWFRRYLDSVVAIHITSSREVYGLTWDEALDEASDFFTGTPAAGTPDAMMAAYKRDNRSGPRRPWTHWETVVTNPLKIHLRPFRRNSWWDINSDRVGPGHGNWLQRPRLLKPRRQTR